MKMFRKAEQAVSVKIQDLLGCSVKQVQNSF